MLKKFFKFLNQKGQSMILYALLTPLLFTVAGAAVDLGWYYLNFSRLQNMADSAVISSAKVLNQKDGDFSNYTYNYFLAAAPENLNPENKNTDGGDLEAKKYISKNLEISLDWQGKDFVTDTFSNADLNFSKKVFPTKDADGYDVLYYEITLTETPKHFFEILEKFGDVKISVKAAAKFTRVPDITSKEDGPTFFEQMEAIKEKKVYAYWEVMQNEYKNEADILKADMAAEIALGRDANEVLESYVEKLTAKYISRGVDKTTAKNRALKDLTADRSADKARERSITTSGNWWLKDLTNYRTENLSLNGRGGTSWNEKQTDFDDIFINFLQDVDFKFSKDWDIGYEMPSGMKIPNNFINCKIFNSATDEKNLRFGYRIFGLIGIEEDKILQNGKFPYKVREGRDSPDPLYARIESETIKWEPYYSKNHSAWNTVRQIFINVNCSNFSESDRPIIFFYDGPKRFDEDSPVRDSKPIILNLNADFRGVIYAPNSPVIVAGNNHKFRGFIIAKEFLKLKTDEDFKNFKKVVRKDNGHTIFVKNESDIKSSATENIPENCIAVTYEDGDKNLFYYLERSKNLVETRDRYFEKISSLKADSKYSPVKIPEIFVDEQGDIVTSEKSVSENEAASVFDLSSAKFYNFQLVKFVEAVYLNKDGGNDVFFLTDRSKEIY